MKFVTYPDSEFMMLELADILASALENVLLTQERASFAVPGGTTPGPIFDTLSAVNLAWDRVDVMLSDERRVPEDHPRSNTRLVKERLLVGQAAAANYINYLPQDDGDLPAKGATLEPHLPLSVLLLGMGADMHTASIFPSSAELDHALTTDAPLVAVQPPDGLEPRISLSMSALKGAMSRHILIVGPDKKAAFEAATKCTAHEAPVAGLLAGTTIHWAES